MLSPVYARVVRNPHVICFASCLHGLCVMYVQVLAHEYRAVVGFCLQLCKADRTLSTQLVQWSVGSEELRRRRSSGNEQKVTTQCGSNTCVKVRPMKRKLKQCKMILAAWGFPESSWGIPTQMNLEGPGQGGFESPGCRWKSRSSQRPRRSHL